MRAAGVLLHPTSLPGGSGIGEIGPEARAFIDWLASAGCRVWQVLPVNPVDRFGCPYASPSATAGDPLLLSLDDLERDGWLRKAERTYAPAASRVDWEGVRRRKALALRLAADRVRAEVDLGAWASEAQRRWALFRALQRAHGEDWSQWPEALRDREPTVVAAAAEVHADDVARELAWQWLFERQWAELRAAADAAGIEIWGDVPFFVGGASADVWAEPELWRLDADRRPLVVSGVPPDAFSATGQLWGHPLYDEAAHAASGHQWWLERFRVALARHHRVRVDHFRGFAGVWEVPAGAPDASSGRWIPGPGAALLERLRATWPELPLVAEDLGVITPDVEALRDGYSLPGMAILQFAFGDDPDRPGLGRHPYLPHHHRQRQVVFTGTHDNDTLIGWLTDADEATRDRARRTLATDDFGLPWAICRAAWFSVADTAIVPMQDLLGLGAAARMNVPGQQEGNWAWRMGPGAMNVALAARIREQVALSGRL